MVIYEVKVKKAVKAGVMSRVFIPSIVGLQPRDIRSLAQRYYESKSVLVKDEDMEIRVHEESNVIGVFL
jgi:hypothetical protein